MDIRKHLLIAVAAINTACGGLFGGAKSPYVDEYIDNSAATWPHETDCDPATQRKADAFHTIYGLDEQGKPKNPAFARDTSTATEPTQFIYTVNDDNYSPKLNAEETKAAQRFYKDFPEALKEVLSGWESQVNIKFSPLFSHEAEEVAKHHPDAAHTDKVMKIVIAELAEHSPAFTDPTQNLIMIDPVQLMEMLELRRKENPQRTFKGEIAMVIDHEMSHMLTGEDHVLHENVSHIQEEGTKRSFAIQHKGPLAGYMPELLRENVSRTTMVLSGTYDGDPEIDRCAAQRVFGAAKKPEGPAR